MHEKRTHETSAPAPRALIVAVYTSRDTWAQEQSLAELYRLADTAGIDAVESVVQRLDAPNPKTYVGPGKLQEIKDMLQAGDYGVVLVDGNLTPSQQFHLEKALGSDYDVIDRCALILNIFTQHATTREGRLQVELARLQYKLPRLRGAAARFRGEQSRGGIGGRFGQGESQLEIDSRLVRNRITKLERELKMLEAQRDIQSKQRRSSQVFRVALAGYTNAGKSSLLNALTQADVYTHDQLFATLDPVTKTFTLEGGREITLTDTVGFIQKLPTTLVEAFKSTLAEVLNAQLIAVVVDASDENYPRMLETVNEILTEIGADSTERLLVFNKCDLLDANQLASLKIKHKEALFVSAYTGFGLDELRLRFAVEASKAHQTITVCIPYANSQLIAYAHKYGRVLNERYEANGIYATIALDSSDIARFEPFIAENLNTAQLNNNS